MCAGERELVALPAVIAVLFVALGCLGMGNGAVFQLVPQRFTDQIGLVTGMIGAAGGLGGFFLPSMLGAVKDATGSYGPGLLLLAGGFAGGAIALLQLGSIWNSRWQPDIVRRAGVFCYRVAVRGFAGSRSAFVAGIYNRVSSSRVYFRQTSRSSMRCWPAVFPSGLGVAGFGTPFSATATKRASSEAGILRQLSQNFSS